MKFVSKFSIRTSSSMAMLCSPWSWHFVRVRPSISRLGNLETLIFILAVIFVVMILAADRNTLACHAV
jgi:hypothetical protein